MLDESGRDPYLANRGRHDEAQHNGIVFCWKRGAGFGISWSEVGLASWGNGGLKRRQKLQFRLLFSLKLALLCKIVAGALHLPV
jgi:hypothetical protein